MHPFSPAEIEEISQAADKVINENIPLTGITKDLFVLPTLGPVIEAIRNELLNGKGFILFKDFPVDEWYAKSGNHHKSAIAYLGLGAHIGVSDLG